ncbi:MAG TPA: FAD-dependent oxidoreductase [Roseimicrobium sp.]|nr:FAD-dependent oxidoreductase [Roseimicrobium sp.]
MRSRFLSIVFAVPLMVATTLRAADYDVVVYGGTAAGVIAAVQAKKMGKTVVLVGPDKHLGGLSSGGLGFTDTGNKSAIGGLSRDFYHRIWTHYNQPESWKWQKQSEYGGKGQGTPAVDGENRTMWIFEPSAAEKVFEDYVREFQIPVLRDEWLDRAKGVKKTGGRITSITMLSGKTFGGKMFIDATYEGDLMAAAGVDYHVGREANSVYDEKWNGNQVGVLHHRHNFGAVKEKISPYVIPGDPKSGVLPRISTEPPGEYGAGDKRVQAYCFRMCVTDVPENRIPFPKPEGYDPKQYELLLRIFNAGWRETFGKFDPIPNHKTDSNNHGPMSTDNIGYNYDYPDASYERRKEIIKEHETYQKGWLYFIANDPRVPEDVRTEMQRWGLPKDEFTDNGNWSHQLYIREARRMIGSFVMTENELLKKKPTPDSVGMGSYTIDSHNVRRYITPEGYVQNEGDIGVPTAGPYEIAYGALVPKRGQADNLFAPVCVSSTHIAYGSIRMEPVFMILAQSAATAASMAIDAKIPVQDVPYAKLREQLLKDGQILELAAPAKGSAKEPKISANGLDPKKMSGVVVDDSEAKLTGEWTVSGAGKTFVGDGYRHDGKGASGKCSARFEATLPKSGRYEVRFAYPPNVNRSSKVAVEITFAGGKHKAVINERQTPNIEKHFVFLGNYDFKSGEPASVTVTNEGSDGYVVIDAVQWVEKK